MRAWLGLWIYAFACAGVTASANPARAQLAAGAEGYALILGSNRGGPGQSTLRYAEADTQRVGDVLTSLGGYPADHVTHLFEPSATQLLAALDRVQQQMQPLAERGVQSHFFFYYSGHACADALNLGGEQLPLAELRECIVHLPTTLSIVVLDACQSGAFSRSKGAEQSADFSFNSVERLNTAGIAVIASSNERELSQDSEELRSSFFTHHWLVGLRGAGDQDHDGRVTLSEAYQYAYNHTLATTAQTAIGEQHATLETNLRGQDDVPLTQPPAASSRLLLPAALSGRALLQSPPNWSVFAELDKSPDDSVVLAAPPGNYTATLRRDGSAARCSVVLQDGRELLLDAQQCALLPAQPVDIKGDALTREQRREQQREQKRAEILREEQEDLGKSEHFALEIGLGSGVDQTDTPYTRRLSDFGFHHESSDFLDLNLRLTINAGLRLTPNLFVGVSYMNLQAREYERDQDVTQHFGWTGHALTAFVQGDFAIGRRRMINFFGRVGAGASLAWTTFDAVQVEPDFPNRSISLEDTNVRIQPVTQHFVRPCGFASGGIQFMPGRYLGLQVEVRYVLAPGLVNLLGDRQDLGGVNIGFALRLRSWE